MDAKRKSNFRRKRGSGVAALDHETSNDSKSARLNRPLSYPSLDTLYEKEPKEIVMYLCRETKEFRRQLQEMHMTKEYFALLLRVLARAIMCDLVPQSVIHLIVTLNECNFFTSHIMPSLSNLLVELTRGTFSSRSEAIIRCTLTLIKSTMLRMPSKFLQMSPLVSLISTIVDAAKQNGVDLDEEIVTDMEDLKEDISSEMENIRIGQRHRARNVKGADEEVSDERNEPPNNFRYLAVFPSFADIMTNIEPYLRPNIPKGAFRDADHYLDVQFRLLREDFICPMREGIAKYLDNLKLPQDQQKKVTDVRTYEDVHIVKPVCHRAEGICHMISFNNANLKHVRWATSKRLLYGSLVCLSKNNFKTLMFATVAKRDIDDLENGTTTLKFQNIDEALDESGTDAFSMIESAAFFEAYRYVLEGLQELNDESLPFERYIVHCEKDLRPPEYLKTIERPCYDISCLLRKNQFDFGQDTSSSVSTGSIPILEDGAWPAAATLNLDESQLKALQMAITKEFAVIQGPPGTGKTHIGLKIVEILLENAAVWQHNEDNESWENEKNSPILVVCYTNHALDQFLEGIGRFLEEGIVRVGSRSKSQMLERFQIANLRPRGTGRNIYGELKCTEDDISGDTGGDDLMQQTFDEEELLAAMPEFHKNSLIEKGMSVGVVKFWLIEKMTQMDEQGFKTFLELVQSKSIKNPAKHEMTEQSTTDVKQQEDVQTVDVEGQGDFINDLRTIDVGGGAGEETGGGSDGVQTDPGMTTETQAVTLTSMLETLQSEAGAYMDDGFQEDKRNTKKRRKKIKHHFDQLMKNTESMAEDEAMQVTDVWSLNLHERWQLCQYWINQVKPMKEIQMRNNISVYERLALQLKETYEEEDLKILGQAKVIGMTTTGAAKYRSLLRQINPKIVIMEEAAEVLESHIVTTITPECQHLILIGDHQQLRPNPTVYDLAKSFNLDISLFERMINNGLHFEKLALQHRMRPEIAAPMKHIYESLQNHDTVKTYKDVRGVAKNMFFINHEEEEELMEDIRSRSNMHEATFLVALCKYLLQQGYKASQITILTMYTAQLIELHRQMPKDVFKGVRVCPVDNFQGEENDIILLSLVRSNQEGSIGFLNISNRVCVALSRARIGFFCIGNFKLLAQKNKLWSKITADLQKGGNIGSSLKLFCRNHPDVVVNCSSSNDFQAVPNGGCKALCEYQLECGHTCQQHCHPCDLDHEDYTCKKSCETKCERGHNCPLPCYMLCEQCKTKIDKVVPTCGHVQMVPCYKDPGTFNCLEPCPKQLPCGHECSNLCHEACPTKCKKLVKKVVGVCGHEQMMECHESTTNFQCQEACEKLLHCGHPCQKRCGESCSEKCNAQVVHDDWPCDHNYLGPCWFTSKDCPVPCQSTLKCGHPCKSQCGECRNGLSHVPCKMPCERSLPCGHACNNLCHQECQTACMEVVTRQLGLCGHKVRMKCCERAPLCPIPCSAPLACGHKCTGTCGLCKSVGSHNICSYRCGRKLVCGHTCFKPCYQSCGPCTLTHNQLCEHRTRGRLCQLNCVWNCRHHQCQKRCHEPCDRQRCNEPCNVQLSCGRNHRCIGLCGEGCPSVCRHCNKDKVGAAAAFFGRNYNKTSRFVQLYCGHLFQVRDLDRMMAATLAQGTVSPIGMKSCPKCNKSILMCTRYKTLIKQSYQDIGTTMQMLQHGSDDIFTSGAKGGVKYMINAIIARDHQGDFLTKLEDASSLVEIAHIENCIMCYRRVATVKCMLQNTLSAIDSHKADDSYLMKSIPESFEDDVQKALQEVDQIMTSTDECRILPEVVEIKGTYWYALYRLAEQQIPVPSSMNVDILLRRLQRENHRALSSMTIPSRVEEVSVDKYRSWVGGDWFKCNDGHVFYHPLVHSSTAGRDEAPQCSECWGGN